MAKSILIAEDEKTLSKALKNALKKEGYKVRVAGDGIECVKSTDEEIPNLIILDLIMPRVDGVDTLRTLKDEEKTKNVPILVLTNYSESDKLSDVLSMGVTDYFTKSEHDLTDIVEKVQKMLGDK